MKTRQFTRSILILSVLLAMLAPTSQAQEPRTDPAVADDAR